VSPRHFFPDRAGPAQGKAPLEGKMKKVALQRRRGAFLSAQLVALGAGFFGDHQLARLIRALNHVPLIIGQPCLSPFLRPAHDTLLPGRLSSYFPIPSGSSIPAPKDELLVPGWPVKHETTGCSERNVG